ncbi:MAG: murein hydrolase activator EnvC family protein [Mangrovibacterium sp.]
MNRRYWLLLIVLVMTVGGAWAQSIEDLRSRKVELNKQIKLLNSLINDASKSEQKSLEALRLLELQVRTRAQLIAELNQEMSILNQRIENNQTIEKMLQSDLHAMKEEYAAMIRLAQVNSNAYDAIIFLLSSDNASQAYQRWLYLRQYAQYRSKQLNVINSISAKMQLNLSQLAEQKKSKEVLLVQKQQELTMLRNQEVHLEQMLRSFGVKQVELQSEVSSQQAEETSLKGEIERQLASEAKKNFSNDADFDKLSKGFLSKKGKLSRPVVNGVVSEKFGAHSHPMLKNVTINSNGIEITTSAGTRPIAIYDGVVSKVFEVSENQAIILRHGTYLTVYSNLSEASVKVGDVVREGQQLGILSSKDGFSVLKFQVWKENAKLDPEEWISR